MLGPSPKPSWQCEESFSNQRTGDQSYNQNHCPNSCVGNQLVQKRSGHTQILLHNTTSIGFCLSQQGQESRKLEKQRKMVLLHKVDIITLTDINQKGSQLYRRRMDLSEHSSGNGKNNLELILLQIH